MNCPKCKSYIPSGISWEHCPECGSSIAVERGQAVAVKTADSRPGNSADVSGWQQPVWESFLNAPKSMTAAKGENLLEKFPFLRGLLTVWGLTWRAVWIPFAVSAPAMIGIDWAYGFLAGGKELPQFLFQASVILWAPLYLFCFEWAANVTARRVYGFESFRFLGGIFYAFFAAAYYLFFAFRHYAGGQALLAVFPDDISLLIVQTFPAVFAGLGASFILERMRLESPEVLKGESTGQAPACLAQKALWYIPGIYLVLAMLLGIAVVSGLLAVASLFLMARIPAYLALGAVIGVGGLVVAVLSAMGEIISPKIQEIAAMAMDLSKQPRFESLLRELAEKTKTQMPDKVIVSASSEFSVQHRKIKTYSGFVKGRILTVSAPLMRILTAGELKGILAHEFGHFAGQDTVFSKRVEPVYAGVAAAVRTIEETRKAVEEHGLMGLMARAVQAAPQALLKAYYFGFYRVSMRISRGREFRSDAIAAEITGKNQFLRGLDKVCVGNLMLNELWDSNKPDFAVEPDTVNYYEAFARLVSRHQDKVPSFRSELLAGEAENMDRIYDSHPPMSLRVQQAQRFSDQPGDENPALSLFDHPEEWEEALTEKMRPLLLTSREDNKLLDKYRYIVQVIATRDLLKKEAFLRDLAEALKTEPQKVQALLKKNLILKASDMSAEEAERVMKAARLHTPLVSVSVDVKATEAALRVVIAAEEQQLRLRPVPVLQCERCGDEKGTAQRVHLKVFSLLFYSVQVPTNPKTLCKACASKLGWGASVITFVFGWWSLPGIFWAPAAIFRNLTGGVIVGPPELVAKSQRPMKKGTNPFTVFFLTVLIGFSAWIIWMAIKYPGARRSQTPEIPSQAQSVESEVKRIRTLGAQYAEQGKTQEAIAEFKKVLALAPDSHSAHYNLGLAYEKAGQNEESAVELAEAVRLKPDYEAAHFRLAVVYGNLGKWDEAIMEYQKTIEINPKNFTAYNNMGSHYADSGKLDEAEAAFKKALDINPGFLTAENNLKKIELKRPKQSTSYYEELLGEGANFSKRSRLNSKQ